jgi:hypothetical protein
MGEIPLRSAEAQAAIWSAPNSFCIVFVLAAHFRRRSTRETISPSVNDPKRLLADHGGYGRDW